MTGTSSVSGEDDAGDVPTLRRSPSAKASEQSSRGCGYEEQDKDKSDENRERCFFLVFHEHQTSQHWKTRCFDNSISGVMGAGETRTMRSKEAKRIKKLASFPSDTASSFGDHSVTSELTFTIADLSQQNKELKSVWR